MTGIIRWITAAFILIACAGENVSARENERPPAPGQWQNRFDRRTGHVTAIFQTVAGVRLTLACDSAGARPGRGSISVSWPALQTPDALPREALLVLESSGRSLSWSAALSIDTPVNADSKKQPAKPPIPVLTAAFALDGEEKNAAVMAALVTLIRSSKNAVSLRLPGIAPDISIGLANQQRALTGFEQGCQNYLPPPDEEVIWDWHQGLDLVDDKRSITLVAQALPTEAHHESGRLTLLCHAGQLRITFQGFPDRAEKSPSLSARDENGASYEIATQRGEMRGDIVVAEQSMSAMLALLRSHEKIMIASGSDANRHRVFPVAGFRLASRLAAGHCPSISH